ncbi:MAG: gamma-glutamyltransferase [Nannocystaceae bacterium]|nr:gamma-glutamyltransferase [Nannocystaceae bacterium]
MAAIGCKAQTLDNPDPVGASAPALEGVAADATTRPTRIRTMPAGADNPPALALGTQGAVSSAEANASDIGLAILRAGGTAVDAAVAVGFALAVTHPSAGNLGGGGFMVIRMADGTKAALDYREEAPGRAHRDMYLDAKGEPSRGSLDGPMAAGIPGTVAGLALAHARFGKLPWKDLVDPAVALARDGHTLDSWHTSDVNRGAKRMHDIGEHASAKYYEKADGVPYVEGDTWVQTTLAATLQAIADDGSAAFYLGPRAEAMAASVRKAGGIWEAKDLAAYRARERDPIVFDYRGYEITTMPPPSAGGVVLRQILAASEVMGLDKKPWRSVEEVHLYVEVARRTYADRNMLLGDPDFVKLPMDQLLDVEYIKQRVANIDPLHATPSSEVGAGLPVAKESHQTTHYSVVDQWGNAASNTYTLNTGFGAKYVEPTTGVLLNNEMDDFAVKPGTANVFGLVQGEPNKIEPGKRMLSSMTPTVIAKDGELRAVIGTPGGPTITTTVAQITRALIDYNLPIDEAVEATRVHHQWLPDRIATESRIDDALKTGLEALGHEVTVWGKLGHANCIEVDPDTKGFRAYADVSRDGGKAVAY